MSAEFIKQKLAEGADPSHVFANVGGDFAQSLEMFMRANRVQVGEVLREVRNCMFDSQYEINQMITKETNRIRELNEQRRRAASCQSQQLK